MKAIGTFICCIGVFVMVTATGEDMFGGVTDSETYEKRKGRFNDALFCLGLFLMLLGLALGGELLPPVFA